MTKNLYVIGDVGGHLQMFKDQLAIAGVNEDCVMPENTTIVQVGDLIHKGPDSVEVCKLVEELLIKNPENYIQLIGNHESQYLCEETWFWNDSYAPILSYYVKKWWEEGKLKYGIYFKNVQCETFNNKETENLLITHAGVAAGLWKGEGSLTPERFVKKLNELPHYAHALQRKGEIWGKNPRNKSAGILWATASGELYPSWWWEKNPWDTSQVHGHTGAYNWKNNSWWGSPFSAIIEEEPEAAELNAAGKIVKVSIKNNNYYGVDPGASMTDVTVNNVLHFTYNGSPIIHKNKKETT